MDARQHHLAIAGGGEALHLGHDLGQRAADPLAAGEGRYAEGAAVVATVLDPVSYTHLDVYKRQVWYYDLFWIFSDNVI